ncbi:Smg-6, nonsense mediated mRNA decay factor [Mortierella sp. GBA43]|nr:Smg-6, nonsense mediated mRNA decay factor [Mortierella sp. GBA43]
MSSSTSKLSPEHHLQTVRQLYLDASLIEQTIQQHVEANRVGSRSTNSSHPSSPASDRRFNLSDTSSTSQRRQGPSPQNQRRSGSSRQQQQTEQEEQGFQVPPSSYFRSSHEELAFLRDSLKDIYEEALLEDLVAAAEKSVDERLWRHVFYTPIEELRAELRKIDKDSTRRQEVMGELGKLLDKGTGFYYELITTLRCDHEIDLNTIAVDVLHADSGVNKSKPTLETKPTQSRTRNGKTRQQSRSKEDFSTPSYSAEALASCIQKCLIYLGDLARYRTNIRLETKTMLAGAQPAADTNAAKDLQNKPTASEWHAAYQFYKRAIQTFPDSGKPFGQLAILASYANDDLDALYWYTLSLGAKCPSTVVRDNLKVFFSRYQNRYKDLLSSICPPAVVSGDAMSTDEDTNTPKPAIRTSSTQQMALSRCELPVLAAFHDSVILRSLCKKLGSALEKGGYETTVQTMVTSLIFVIHDLHARTSMPSFSAESSTKEGAMGLKQAQRAGLIYVLSMATVVLDQQLPKEGSGGSSTQPNQELLSTIHILIEFWISHWDQVWGMIRLEDRWAGVSDSADFSLRNATTAFFKSFIALINSNRPQDTEHLSFDDVSYRALSLLQLDRDHRYGLLPFRRFHAQLTVCYDVVENATETKQYRMLFFADKVIQASEGIRGTVIELSMEVGSDEEEVETRRYKLLDADEKRLIRERGSKMLASHWLQDQVSSHQKGLENTERRSPHQDGSQSRKETKRARALVPISTLPGMVKLPLSGQTRLTDHYQRAMPKSVTPNSPQQGRPGSDRNNVSQSRSRTDKYPPPVWTCILDFSVLVWNLAEIKVLLDHHQCLLIVPWDVIDRLDQAKKGQDKENQKAREAIRFLDERLNIPRWGMSEPLLVGQNIKDSLSRWSEAVPFLVEENGAFSRKRSATAHGVEQDGDITMEDAQTSGGPDTVTRDNEPAEHDMSLDKDNDDQELNEVEVEVRNAMNVPRVWRPILGACLFMLRKREEAHRIPEDRFMLLTEDQDLLHYAGWFNIPTSSIHTWKHNGL